MAQGMSNDVSWAFYSLALPPSHCLPLISSFHSVWSGVVLLFSCHFVVTCEQLLAMIVGGASMVL
jgi:hypothetical protein